MVMILDLMHAQNFCYQVVSGVKNIVTFGVGNSLLLHADNSKEDILVLGEEPTNGSDDTKNSRG